MATRQPAQRRDDEPAFVLHAYPYRETSLIVEAFTPNYGRVAMVARGAKRPRSETRGLLQAFQPLTLSWAGTGELKTLMKAEWRGGMPLPGGSALLAGFYVNELLMKLLPREDAHPALFDEYAAVLAALTERTVPAEQAAVLRRFEVRLLAELGYALALTRDVESGEPIAPQGRYHYVFDRGPMRIAANEAHEPGGARAAGARRHAAGADDAGFPRRRRRGGGEAADARGARPSPRGAADLQPPRRAGPHGTGRGRTGNVIELGVNIDHVATLRQARGTYEPDPVWAAVEAHLGGADGITVHLREDRRHIQDHDVRRLRDLVHIKLNLEMAATPEMTDIACDLRPEMAMLVPEGRHEITTEGGLDVAGQEAKLAAVVARLADAGIVTSVFIDAELAQVEAAARIGARVCEVHTGPYAHAFHAKGRDPESAAVVAELERIRAAGAAIRALDMRFNAGHALNYFNVQPVAALPGVRELHIGHAIVSRAVFTGLREAVRQMKSLLREAAARGSEAPG